MIRRSLVWTLMSGALLAALGYSHLSTPAVAQSSCGSREQLVKLLSDQFKEQPVSIGLARPGQVMEVFASPSGSWSMVMTMPNGTSCLIAAGENWEMLKVAKGDAI